MAREHIDDPVIKLISKVEKPAVVPWGFQFEHLDGIARSAQDPAVANNLSLYVKQPGTGSCRCHQAAHHLAGEIGKQDFALIDGVENSTFPKCGRKDFALGLQRLDLLPDQARLVFPEVKETAREKRERQHIDGKDAASER